MSELRKLRHAGGVFLYRRDGSCNKWMLPVCSEIDKDKLSRLNPNHQGCWECVDMDGCPTICYLFTGKLVKKMNSERKFTSFFAQFKDALGEGPVKEYFNDLWLKNNNIKALARNKWERLHGVRTESAHRNMSVREAARMSIC